MSASEPVSAARRQALDEAIAACEQVYAEPVDCSVVGRCIEVIKALRDAATMPDASNTAPNLRTAVPQVRKPPRTTAPMEPVTIPAAEGLRFTVKEVEDAAAFVECYWSNYHDLHGMLIDYRQRLMRDAEPSATEMCPENGCAQDRGHEGICGPFRGPSATRETPPINFSPIAETAAALRLKGELEELREAVRQCAEFLKDGESPAECIKRNRRDIDALLTLLAQAKAAQPAPAPAREETPPDVRNLSTNLGQAEARQAEARQAEGARFTVEEVQLAIRTFLARLLCDSDHEFAEPVRREALRLRAIAATLGKNHPVRDAAPSPAPRKGPKCINCGVDYDGGYCTEDIGPFCSLCWEALQQVAAPSPAPPASSGAPAEHWKCHVCGSHHPQITRETCWQCRKKQHEIDGTTEPEIKLPAETPSETPPASERHSATCAAHMVSGNHACICGARERLRQRLAASDAGARFTVDAILKMADDADAAAGDGQDGGSHQFHDTALMLRDYARLVAERQPEERER